MAEWERGGSPSRDDFAAAVEASRYFGLDELADLLHVIATTGPDDGSPLQAAYNEIDSDGVIERAFRRRLLNTPQDFEPL